MALVNLITTDFSKGMGVLKDITVAVMKAVVDSLVITGQIAARGFVNAFGEELGKWLIEMGKPDGVLGKLSLAVPAIAATRLSLMKAGIDLIESARLEKPIRAAERYAAAWEDVGIAMSSAAAISPTTKNVPVGTTPGIFGGGGIEKILRKPESFGESMGGFEPSAVGGGSLVDLDEAANRNQLLVDMHQEAAEEMLQITQERLEVIKEDDALQLEEKVEAIQLLMDKEKEQFGAQTKAYKILAAQQAAYNEQILGGLAKTGKAVNNWIKQSMDMGKKMGEIFTNIFKGIALNLTEMLMDGKDRWKDFGKSILKMLASMIIQLMIAALLTSIISWGTAAAKGGSALASAVSSLQSIQASKATGGFVEKTGTYQLHRGEKVVTKSEMASAEGTGNTINIINQAGPGITLEEEEIAEDRVVNIIIKRAGIDGPLMSTLGLE